MSDPAVDNRVLSLMGSRIMDLAAEREQYTLMAMTTVRKVDGKDTVVGINLVGESPVAVLLKSEINGILRPILNILVNRFNGTVLEEKVPLIFGHYYNGHPRGLVVITWMPMGAVGEERVYLISIDVRESDEDHGIEDDECIYMEAA